MEGRAIARPNWTRTTPSDWRTWSFNGGPGNCPAKPDFEAMLSDLARAPSMEGRAIARPNLWVMARP